MEKSETSLDFSVLRDLRKRAGLTLSEVSNQSGISVAGLSKIERNQSMVEINTLFRLSRVFGLSATDVLSLAESCTARKKTVRHYKSGFFQFESVRFDGINCFHASAKAGEVLKKPEAHGDDYEICWVREGEIRINLPHEQHRLLPSEALKFDAALEHTYEIIKDSKMIILHLEKEHRF